MAEDTAAPPDRGDAQLENTPDYPRDAKPWRKLIEQAKPKKLNPPIEVKSAGHGSFDVSGRGNRAADVCPRGGDHEWI